jgi:tetratricopeptide (TPR) repeat protein
MVAAAACAFAGGCGDDDEPRPAREVQELVLPTDSEREADQKRHEAEVFIEAGKPSLAEAPLRRVLELTPKDVRAAEMLAQCLLDRGKPDEAVPLLRKAVAGGSRRTSVRMLLVRTLLTQGDVAGAEQAAFSWTGVDGTNADAWFDLGRARYRLGKLDDAIQAFRRAETLKPSRADIRSELGLALAASGQLARAEAKQRDALDREPDYAEAWFRLGDVITRRDPDRSAEAAEAFGRAVSEDPSLVLAHLYLFRVCRLAKVPDGDPLRARGEAAWKEVLRLHGRTQLASVLGTDGARDAATSEFVLQEKVSLAPDDPAPRLALAKFLHGERRFDEAIAAYRRALECGAAPGPTRMRLAAALVAHGDPAGAETELRAGFEGASGDAAVHRLLAWILLVQGKDADAATAAEAALQIAPDDALAKKERALARIHASTDAAVIDTAMNEIASLGWL